MGIFFALPFFALVSLNGYAWSHNIGWIKFAGPSYSVTINDQTGAYGGYAWSERVGWIKFSGDSARVCSATAGGDCSNEISENVSGWDGIIKLNGPSYKTEIKGSEETGGCYLSGYAWGSNVVGWIKMRGATYGVNLERCIIPPEPPHIMDLSCSFTAGQRVLISPQRSARLTWSCVDADQCSISNIGSVSKVGGSRTVTPGSTTTYTLRCENDAGQSVAIPQTVRVIGGTLCEINPADPGCQ